jgi:hypothetical protein
MIFFYYIRTFGALLCVVLYFIKVEASLIALAVTIFSFGVTGLKEIEFTRDNWWTILISTFYCFIAIWMTREVIMGNLP